MLPARCLHALCRGIAYALPGVSPHSLGRLWSTSLVTRALDNALMCAATHGHAKAFRCPEKKEKERERESKIYCLPAVDTHGREGSRMPCQVCRPTQWGACGRRIPWRGQTGQRIDVRGHTRTRESISLPRERERERQRLRTRKRKRTSREA